MHFTAVPHLLQPMVMGALVLLVLLGGKPLHAEDLTIGITSDEPRRKTTLFFPVISYITDRLNEQGGDFSPKVLITPSIEEMVSSLKSGAMDFYIDSPLVSTVINKRAGSSMVLRRWKKGVSKYHSVFLVRNSSTIKSLQDIPGSLVGFEDLSSSSGYFLPMIALQQNGLKTERVSLGNRPAKDRVGYLFTSDEENTMAWLLAGKIDVAAMSNQDYDDRINKDADKVRLIGKTFDIPRMVVNFPATMPIGLGEKIKNIMMGMVDDEEGRQVLSGFDRTVKFDAIPQSMRDDLAANEEILLNIADLN